MTGRNEYDYSDLAAEVGDGKMRSEVAVQSGDTRSFTARASRLLSSEYVTAQWPLAASRLEPSDGSY